MARPGTLYAWGAASPVVPTSGHQASGWATNEIPGANETSTLLNNWWQELAYLDSVAHFSGTIAIPLAGFSARIVQAGSGASVNNRLVGGQEFLTIIPGSTAADTTTVLIPVIMPPTRWTISEISFNLDSLAYTTYKFGLQLVAIDGTVTSLVEYAFTGSGSAHSTFTMSTVLTSGSLPIAAATLTAGALELYFSVDNALGGSTYGDLFGVQLTVTN